jgi:oligoribonuclease (3'-5' exoribonuclease)
MPHDESEDMIETKQLIERLEGMQTAMKRQSEEYQSEMKKQAEDRHRVNNTLHQTMHSVVQKTQAQDVVLADIREDVSQIKTCLIGDSEYQRIGLIADVVAVKARLAVVEDTVKSRTRAAVVAFTVLGVAGGVITWIKGTGFFKLFTQ